MLFIPGQITVLNSLHISRIARIRKGPRHDQSLDRDLLPKILNSHQSLNNN